MIDIIEKYKRLNQNITEIIYMTGYKIDFVYKQLGWNRNKFYNKRKKSAFTPEELEKILNIISFEYMILKDKNKEKQLTELLNKHEG